MTTIPDATGGLLASWGQAVADFLNDRTARTSSTGNITTSETQVIGATIPADSLIAGTTYRLTAYGVAGNNTSGGARSLTLAVRIGTTTLTGNIAGSRAPNLNSTANGEGFGCEFLFTVRTAGASGTCIANGWTMSGPSEPLNTNAFVSNKTSTVAVDTTVANVLELTAVTGHANAPVTFHNAVIERLTP